MYFYKDNNDQVYAHEFKKYAKKGLVEITKQEADALLESQKAAQKQARFNSLSYSEKRLIEYGSPSEQMEFITENGFDAWQAKVAEIKAKYPKASEE